MTGMQRFAKRVFDLAGVFLCEMVNDAYHPLRGLNHRSHLCVGCQEQNMGTDLDYDE